MGSEKWTGDKKKFYGEELIFVARRNFEVHRGLRWSRMCGRLQWRYRVGGKLRAGLEQRESAANFWLRKWRNETADEKPRRSRIARCEGVR